LVFFFLFWSSPWRSGFAIFSKFGWSQKFAQIFGFNLLQSWQLNLSFGFSQKKPWKNQKKPISPVLSQF